MNQPAKRWIRILVLAAMLLLILLCALRMRGPSGPVTLNLSLYPVLPEYEAFKETVRECWKERHPDVELNFVEWDCYGDEVPEDLDVFVVDTTNLDTFVGKGCLLPLSEEDIQEYDDLVPSIMEGCRVDGTIYVVPQLLCTDILYTRKSDAELSGVQNIDDLYAVLGPAGDKDDGDGSALDADAENGAGAAADEAGGDGEAADRAAADEASGDGRGGLLFEKTSNSSKVCLYMQALTDEEQRYIVFYPPIEEGSLSGGAVDSMLKIAAMRQVEPGGIPADAGWYYYAQRFADGMGRAYIGYSEAMDVMGEHAAEMDFRLFSMRGDGDIPVFYVDAAAVNAHISKEKKALAIELMNMITGTELMARVSKNEGNPRYLLSARYSVYDELAGEYPIYAGLKKIAALPDAHVFRIVPDGYSYMEEAEENAGALPDLQLK